MAVTVKDLLGLPIMKNFKVIAGSKGLTKTITTTEILDFEFIREGYRERIFEGNSLVLSSLLFAKDQPELIFEAIKKLVYLNVHAFAYKPVFFNALPQEALDYAEKMSFPILEFGDDEFFEEIIFSIRGLVEKDHALGFIEPLLKEMVNRDFTKEEAEAARDQINPLLRPVVVALCVKVKGMDESQVMHVIRRSKPDERLASKTFVGKLNDQFIILLSSDELNTARYQAIFEDVMVAYGLAGNEFTIGIGHPRNLAERFELNIREAYWAEKVAEIENEDVKYYKDLGIYKLIVTHINSKRTEEYMRDYLAPIFDEDDKDADLLQTAIEYVLAKGDMIKAAERLYCHKNTIRYRIGKLQEKLDPNTNEKEFYQNLAAAIKVYLLLNMIRQQEEEK